MRREAPNIDILPMACVGLILVLVMMMVAPMVLTHNATPVEVPQTHTAERKTENDVTITYTADGRLYFNDEPVADFDELYSRIATEIARDPYVLVVVRADKECLHSSVLDILACARRAGAARIACATKKIAQGG
ncbi:MAG: biopolymer transporter ExbD [candidate division WOR-3 bacterium]|nr:biopolymer transporter ExbD [candidate division WOR-3 bacterium]MCR4423059.1 biopolymer transporter ExbD [candidate division WOR-3 bacterium]MDH7518398.1 biopolymer transporter ExbD [bacterium]